MSLKQYILAKMGKIYEDSILVFGYGSLISGHSLQATVPDAKHIKPAYIKGFRRDFSVWDPEGWTETEQDVAGIPFCALDVTKGSGKNVNGVVFEMGQDNFIALKRREQEYELLETTAFDFVSHKPIGLCLFFSANKKTGRYVFNEPAQERYMAVMLDAARKLGDNFYNQFLATTYINGTAIINMPEFLQNFSSRPES